MQSAVCSNAAQFREANADSCRAEISFLPSSGAIVIALAQEPQRQTRAQIFIEPNVEPLSEESSSTLYRSLATFGQGSTASQKL